LQAELLHTYILYNISCDPLPSGNQKTANILWAVRLNWLENIHSLPLFLDVRVLAVK